MGICIFSVSPFFFLQSRGVSLCHSFLLLLSCSLCFYSCPLITSCLSLFSELNCDLHSLWMFSCTDRKQENQYQIFFVCFNKHTWKIQIISCVLWLLCWQPIHLTADVMDWGIDLILTISKSLNSGYSSVVLIIFLLFVSWWPLDPLWLQIINI